MRRKAREDPVTPDVARYVITRDGGCVLANLVVPGRVLGPCRGRITVAHVRDRLGGRTGKRPPSIPRRLVGCCEGHHLDDPLVDRPEVREELEKYLEAKEGPEPDDSRPWEIVARVRRPAAMLPVPRSDEGREEP